MNSISTPRTLPKLKFMNDHVFEVGGQNVFKKKNYEKKTISTRLNALEQIK